MKEWNDIEERKKFKTHLEIKDKESNFLQIILISLKKN